MTTPETASPDDEAVPAPSETRASMFGRRTLKSPNEALQPEAAPPPPPPKKKKREGALSAFSGFLSFLLVLCVSAGFGLVALQKKMREPGPLPADKVVYIAPGTEVPDIIALLEREGVIDSPSLLNAELVLEGSRSKLKAGEYMFHQNATMREVLDELVNGRQILHAITIPEGLTSQQIVERLRGNDLLVGDMKEIPPEGSLLPETYKVARGASIHDLIRKMQDAEKKMLDQVWARRSPDLPLHSPYELLTLASIVEKETGKADERPRVAGVFVNRLQKRMRLQSDPTIVYGLVGGRGTLGRGILRSEVEKWTPYNTYAIDGLPPGPIANPGRAALEAVANPSRTQDLYFVADGTGGHVFASSLDEHARNVARWRQIERDARDRGNAADVDHAQPLPAPPPAPATTGNSRVPQQRSDAGAPNFGRLASFDGPPPVYFPNAGSAPEDISLALSLTHPKMPPLDDLRMLAKRDVEAPVVADSATWDKAKDNGKTPITASFADPGIRVQGVDGDDTIDGPMNDNLETYPVPARTLAEQKAAAAKLGLARAVDSLPDEPSPTPPVQTAEPRHYRAIDASEGTPLDPLRNKTWDLNYPKNVPAVLAYH
ncbi:MAG: endolytic transglycosylase MltG [Hyphomicrobiales bacterium]|nr:endolytic transglycosylase MltG [Hyphomicrobiales bacterium]